MSDKLSKCKKYWPEVVIGLMVVFYFIYFSFTTIVRMQNHNARYFDLAIMHQTTFNTYRAITNFDFSRILEQTDTFGEGQIKRMAIHNDPLLGLLSIFYFVYAGPETLLVIQSLVVALGAVFIYLISCRVNSSLPYYKAISVFLALIYLLNPFIQRANNYEFHAITLGTTLLLGLFYFWLDNRLIYAVICWLLLLLTKENASLAAMMFGVYALWQGYHNKKKGFVYFALIIMVMSLIYFILSVGLIIPHFQSEGSKHFALSYYEEFGSKPVEIIVNMALNPHKLIGRFLALDKIEYLHKHFTYTSYLALLSPETLIMALPDIAINLVSTNENMINTHLHYTSLITPAFLLSLIFALGRLYKFSRRYKLNEKQTKLFIVGICILIAFGTLYSAYRYGPLWFASQPEVNLPADFEGKQDVQSWSHKLQDENYKISSTESIAPFFTSRRYFYLFNDRYVNADYVVLKVSELGASYMKEAYERAYVKLIKDENFKKIYDKNGIEVFMRIQNKNLAL